ncbi:MAG: tRNA (adenosine(37)-N6)-threonylcarbamoyltransferase complex dimerization subunit type 1 TsaB [Alphaproteobacteria bacterium]|nr:tRNA (adenosine(37)-N6)-threonylcarbamoyltransferase complex dimerization subunit type 1 TsaB [Alphaproteobacteria bacterium]
MILLAVDTSGHLCAACLYDTAADAEPVQVQEDIGRGHAERLFPVVDQVLSLAGRSYADLDRLAVCIGPGSFTGVRVGVAAMRGLSLALEIPLVGISVFDAIRRPAGRDQPVLVAIDARRNEVYVQLSAAGDKAVQSPQVMSPEAAGALAVQSGAALIGSGVAALRPFLPSGPESPAVLGEESVIDLIGLARIAADREPGQQQPVPLYLRAPDAKPQTGFALPRRQAAP